MKSPNRSSDDTISLSSTHTPNNNDDENTDKLIHLFKQLKSSIKLYICKKASLS